jgi:hypothetical protein
VCIYPGDKFAGTVSHHGYYISRLQRGKRLQVFLRYLTDYIFLFDQSYRGAENFRG